MTRNIWLTVAVMVAALAFSGGLLATQSFARGSASSQVKPGYSLPHRPGVSDFGLTFGSVGSR